MKAEEGETPSHPRFLPPPEPICRLRVDTSGGFESFSILRFGQKDDWLEVKASKFASVTGVGSLSICWGSKLMYSTF
ncbi:unnamed protein product [Dibothriocephalus latus]|uniref:Uncharacterized protein n=1 Tax=Dibothriocephalus latus TaxID=60516 RepID=A0A3P7QIE1_DIBLA|nr:unnamed protein product [Dibothriocephalus latus]